MKESSESSAPPTRSDKYYLAEGDVIFRIERTLFRFHSYHLSRATTYFDNLLETTPPASWNSAGSEADDRPIALDDVRAGEFEALLWFFYESGYSWAPRVDSITNDTNERWESVVLLAEKYAMPDIARVATCALIRGEALLDDIRRISLCAKHGLSKTLVQGELQKVISRETPLSAVEMRQLGFDVSAVLARAREEYAHSAGRRDSDCDDSICDTCDAYAPCHMGMHICLNNYEHSHACPEPSDVNPIIDSIDWEGISRAIHRVSELQDRSNAWGSALGDLYIKVEGKILQLHSYHLKRATRVFSDTLSLPDNPGYVKEGAAPTHPKALEGAHTDWNALIWFFYDSPYEWSETANKGCTTKWESVLRLAERYKMEEVCRVAVNALDHLDALTDIQKIKYSIKHRIGVGWAVDSIQAVIRRDSSLTAQDAEELGISLTMQLVQLREEHLRS